MRVKKYFWEPCTLAIILISGFSVFVAVKDDFIWYVLMVVALFLFVGFMPTCNRRENMWMFFLVAMCSFSINFLWVLRHIVVGKVLLCFVLRSLVYFLLLSVEEIVMAFFTRILWNQQYQLPKLSSIKEDDDKWNDME